MHSAVAFLPVLGLASKNGAFLGLWGHFPVLPTRKSLNNFLMLSVVHGDNNAAAAAAGFTIVVKGNMLYSTLKYLPFMKIFVGEHLDLK